MARQATPMIGQKLSVIALILGLLGCSLPTGTNVVASTNSTVEVRGDKIYRNGKIYAELRYLFPASTGDKYYGLAIYYYPSRQEVWIYPEGGWQIRGGSKKHYTVSEIEEAKANRKGILREGKPLSKEQAIAGWCFDINISRDGRFVSYTTYSSFRIFSESLSRRSGQYLVDYEYEEALSESLR